jgi:hypothetical protein
MNSMQIVIDKKQKIWKNCRVGAGIGGSILLILAIGAAGSVGFM